MPDRIAYIPLATYPEAPSDASVRAAISFVTSLKYGLHVSTFSVEMPPVASALAGYVINFDGMARAAEECSTHECTRFRGLIDVAAPSGASVRVTSCAERMGGALNAAAIEARYFDLAVVPRSDGTQSCQDLAQALVFGPERPVILVPPSTAEDPLNHIAIAWDESHIAARAFGGCAQPPPSRGEGVGADGPG